MQTNDKIEPSSNQHSNKRNIEVENNIFSLNHVPIKYTRLFQVENFVRNKTSDMHSIIEHTEVKKKIYFLPMYIDNTNNHLFRLKNVVPVKNHIFIIQSTKVLR